jgi:hypothetical protein
MIFSHLHGPVKGNWFDEVLPIRENQTNQISFTNAGY